MKMLWSNDIMWATDQVGVSGGTKMEAKPLALNPCILIVLHQGPATEHLRAEIGLYRGLVISQAIQEIIDFGFQSHWHLSV